MGTILKPDLVGPVVAEAVKPFADVLSEGHHLLVLVLDTSQEEPLVAEDVGEEGTRASQEEESPQEASEGDEEGDEEELVPLVLSRQYFGPPQLEDDLVDLVGAAYEVATQRDLTSAELYDECAVDVTECDPLPKNGLAWGFVGNDVLTIVISMDRSLSEEVLEVVQDAVLKHAKDRLQALDEMEEVLFVGEEEVTGSVVQPETVVEQPEATAVVAVETREAQEEIAANMAEGLPLPIEEDEAAMPAAVLVPVAAGGAMPDQGDLE